MWRTVWRLLLFAWVVDRTRPRRIDYRRILLIALVTALAAWGILADGEAFGWRF